MKPRLLAALLPLATLSLSSPCWAFCRATTCDSSSAVCGRDESLCLTTGQPLFWASQCVQVYVQASGSPKQGIPFATLKESVSRAFAAWLSAECGGAAPLLDVQVLGPISCAASEYNSTKKNANIVMFRDEQWPYVGAEDALAFTHLQFNADTGELWDADLEINSFEYRFSAGDPVTQNDLDSMLTHEAGHMLGLAHTLVKDATMFAQYSERTSELRTLAADDVKGVCATYAPDRVPQRTSCSPRHGFSDRCGAEQPENSGTDEGTAAAVVPGETPEGTRDGCAFAASPPKINGVSALVSALLVTLAGRRQRRSSRHRFVACRRASHCR